LLSKSNNGALNSLFDELVVSLLALHGHLAGRVDREDEATRRHQIEVRIVPGSPAQASVTSMKA
jgi:siroheme synthase